MRERGVPKSGAVTVTNLTVWSVRRMCKSRKTNARKALEHCEQSSIRDHSDGSSREQKANKNAASWASEGSKDLGNRTRDYSYGFEETCCVSSKARSLK